MKTTMEKTIIRLLLMIFVMGLVPYPQQISAQGDDEQYIATVNDITISIEEFQARATTQRWLEINELRAAYQFAGEDIFSVVYNRVSLLDTYPEDIGMRVLENMVFEILLEKEALERSIEVTETDIEAEIETYLRALLSIEHNATAEEIESVGAAWYALAKSEAAIEREQLNEIFYFRALQNAIKNVVTNEMFATGELYDTIITATTRHILISVSREWTLDFAEADCDNPEWEPYRQAAEAVLVRLNNGESFEDLAAELSDDPSNSQNGGLIPETMDTDDRFVEPYAEAVRNGAIGTYLGPVCTAFGFHIIEILERTIEPRSEESMEELRDEAYLDWESDLFDSATLEYVENWEDFVPNEPNAADLVFAEE